MRRDARSIVNERDIVSKTLCSCSVCVSCRLTKVGEPIRYEECLKERVEGYKKAKSGGEGEPVKMGLSLRPWQNMIVFIASEESVGLARRAKR